MDLGRVPAAAGDAFGIGIQPRRLTEGQLRSPRSISPFPLAVSSAAATIPTASTPPAETHSSCPRQEGRESPPRPNAAIPLVPRDRGGGLLLRNGLTDSVVVAPMMHKAARAAGLGAPVESRHRRDTPPVVTSRQGWTRSDAFRTSKSSGSMRTQTSRMEDVSAPPRRREALAPPVTLKPTPRLARL